MRWTIKPDPLEEDISKLAHALSVDYLIAKLLLQRGVDTFEKAKKFFRPTLSDLHDPFLLKDMDKAVSRIEQAINCGENILVYGDYDVDGTTAVALVSSYLEESYSNIATYIPDRYSEGYGISYQGIDFAEDNGFSLIIALDCGIKAIDKVDYAKNKGIDFIICDHHRPGNTIPSAVAVLDPKREDCSYPYKELCGCGVGFKLIQALATKKGDAINDLIPFLDLVATAIAADIVPMTGENRVLTYYGLQVMNSQPRMGLQAILNQLKKKVLTITDVVFIIAPRINAAGRMKHGQYAVTLLKSTNLDEAEKFASEIEQFNSDRRGLDQEITKEALEQIRKNEEEDNSSSVVFKETWHKGVIGIVASRIMETYYRPTLVFTRSNDKLAASARSVKGFDVYEALQECSEYIDQFGGHKYAAGLTLSEVNFEAFKSKFENVVKTTIEPKLLTPEVQIDAIIDLHQINPKLMRILKQFAPFGPGNMRPIFMSEGVMDSGYGKGVGEGEKHLKLQVIQNGAQPIGAIGFGLGEKLHLVKNQQKFKVVYTIDENEWNGTVSLQLKLKDLK